MAIAVESQFMQLRNSPKNCFCGASTGFEPVTSSCVRAAVLHQPSYEDPYIESWSQFFEFINPRKEWNAKWNEMKIWPSQLHHSSIYCKGVSRPSIVGANLIEKVCIPIRLLPNHGRCFAVSSVANFVCLFACFFCFVFCCCCCFFFWNYVCLIHCKLS